MNNIKGNIKKKQKSKSYAQVKSYLKTYADKKPAALARAKQTYYAANKQNISVYNQEARRQRNMLFTDKDKARRERKLDCDKKRYAFMTEAKRMRDIYIDS